MGESTEGNLHLVDDPTRAGVVNVFGLHSLEDIINVPVTKLAAATQVSWRRLCVAGTLACVTKPIE